MSQKSVDLTVPVLLGIVISFIFLIIYRQVKIFSFWRSRGIPGPQPWPFLGTNVYYLFKKRVHQDEEWHAKYGKTYGCFEGFIPTLRTIDNEIIKHVFIKQFASFNDRPNQAIVSDHMKKWPLFSSGPHWSNQRSIVSPLFTSGNMRSLCIGMGSALDRLSAEIKKRTQSESSDVTLSKDELMALNVDVIATTFFSLKLNTYTDKTSEFFKRAFAFSKFNVPYFIFWLFTPLFVLKAFKLDPIPASNYEYFYRLSQSIINDRRKKSPSESKPRDLIQSLIDAELPDQPEKTFSQETGIDDHYNDGMNDAETNRLIRDAGKKISFRKLDDSEIKGNTTFFFLAGFETTSSSLSFCFYQLAHSADVQEELFDELQSLGKKSSNEIEFSDISQLVKLSAFISETLRFFPPVIDINRRVTKLEGVHLPIEGRTIYLPENTGISVTTKSLHHHSDYWSEPKKFDISRFYPENKDKLTSCTYMPFGIGPKYCAGTRFALTNLKLTISRILFDYKIRMGKNSTINPPEYLQHSFFLQFKNTDFNIVPRTAA